MLSASPGGPDGGAGSGTDYEKLLTNIKTAQNGMPKFPGTTAAKLQYLGSVTKWNGEVEIYKGDYNWNVVNLHGRRYIVDADASNCVLRGAAAGSDGITVTWRTDPVAETYLVYRRSSPSGVWTSLTSTAVDGQYLDTTAQPDTTYYYTVVGANGQYTSLSKDETTNTIPAPAATI